MLHYCPSQTYRDEVNMGQCYMEFTTYSIFTKGENPLEAFMRAKRDVDFGDEFVPNYDYEPLLPGEEGRSSRSDSKQAQIETIKVLLVCRRKPSNYHRCNKRASDKISL